MKKNKLSKQVKNMKSNTFAGRSSSIISGRAGLHLFPQAELRGDPYGFPGESNQELMLWEDCVFLVDTKHVKHL